MVTAFKASLTVENIKAKALEFGADLVGIADGRVMDAHPPSPENPRTPGGLTELDSDSVIVMAKHVFSGTSRICNWGDRHKFYNDELALSSLEQASLEFVYWLEDKGYPSVIVPPSHVDPWRYGGDPKEHMDTLLSLEHAAVEAGLGTLGLNLQLLTPEYGPRVILTAVLSSVNVVADQRMEESLCLGPACGRCLKSCPGDTIKHWQRDWNACDKYRFPYGFNKLTEHLSDIIDEDDVDKQKQLVVSENTFYLWQSILRGAGAMNGCRNCQDVCPVGEDYERHLKDVREEIAENTPEKQVALTDMQSLEQQGQVPESYNKQKRWIGSLAYLENEDSV